MRGALRAVAVAVALAVLCALCACSGATGSAASQSSREQDLPTIKIGADALDPLFYMGRSGEYVGIDADIAREACRRAGLEPKFVNVGWNERDDRLADGTVDCLWSGFAIDGREDDYCWTDPYLDTALAVIVEDRSPSTSLDDFAGPGGVAVRANSIAEQFFLDSASFSDARGIPVHSYGSADMAKTAFVKNFTDAWASYKLVLGRFMADNPGLYRYLDDDLVTMHLGVAFEKGYDGPYRDALNDALNSMKRDGTIDDIVQRYVCETDQGEAVADE